MNNTLLLISAVAVPMAGSFLLPLVGRISSRFRNFVALFAVMTAFVCSVILIPSAISGKAASVSVRFPAGFDITLTADALAVFMAIVSSAISAVIVFYSFGYISHYPHQAEYYFMVVLFLGSMMGIVFSANLICLYIFWEMTALASWRLIGFFREREYVMKADKAFLITMAGALLMLIGFLMIYQKTGSFDLAVIKTRLATDPISNIAAILILCGILSKSATLPFHTWLPDAGVAPSPVTALLHAAVLVKIGVYVFARLFIATFTMPEIVRVIFPAIIAASAIISGGAALIETDMKRIIAYSTVSQIAFIFLGFAVGAEAGIAGALLFILMHGLAKGGLFLCAGIVEQNTKTRDITKMGGLIETMPLTAAAFLACALSVMGIPPFGGFFSKYLVMSAAITDGQFIISMVFLFGAVLTILYLFRIFNMIFMGQANGLKAKEGSAVMIASVVLLAILSLAAGIYIAYPAGFAQAAVKQMLGV